MLKRISKEQSVCRCSEDLHIDDMEKCHSIPFDDEKTYLKIVQNTVLCSYISSSYFHKRINGSDMYMIFPYYYLDGYSESEITAIFKKSMKPCGKTDKHSGFSAVGLTDKFIGWIENNGNNYFPEIFLPLLQHDIKNDEKHFAVYQYYDNDTVKTDKEIYQQVSLLFNDGWFAEHGNLNISYMTLDEINSSPLVKAVADFAHNIELYCYPLDNDNNTIYVKYLHWTNNNKQ